MLSYSVLQLELQSLAPRLIEFSQTTLYFYLVFDFVDVISNVFDLKEAIFTA